jgi:hypothetical protein
MMRQAQIAQGMISKLRHTLMNLKDLETGEGMTKEWIEVLLKDIADTLREQHRYIQLVEQKCEQAEIQASRRRFF